MERLDTEKSNWKHIAKLPSKDGELYAVWVWQTEEGLANNEVDLVELRMCDSDGRSFISANYRRSPRLLRRQQGDHTSKIYDYELTLNDEGMYLFGHPQNADFGRVAVDHHFLTRKHSRGLWAVSGVGSREIELYRQLGFEQAERGLESLSNEIYFALPRTIDRPRRELPA